MIWDVLSRRRCAGKLMSDISFAYSVKLNSNSPHVLVCLSQGCEIRAPHCVNTLDSQVLHSYKLVMPSKDMFPRCGSTATPRKITNLHRTQNLNDTFFRLEHVHKTTFHERIFTPHFAMIGGSWMIQSSWSVDQVVHGFQQTDTLVKFQLHCLRQLGN